MSIQIKYKRLCPEAKAPCRATNGAAGCDLYCVKRVIDDEHNALIYHTGLAFEIPHGYVGLLFPRSSIYKLPLFMPYSVGVIDSDYRGEVLAIFKDVDYGNLEPNYSVGERCCQLLIVELPTLLWKEVKTLSVTERGEGGHGSTGVK